MTAEDGPGVHRPHTRNAAPSEKVTVHNPSRPQLQHASTPAAGRGGAIVVSRGPLRGRGQVAIIVSSTGGESVLAGWPVTTGV